MQGQPINPPTPPVDGNVHALQTTWRRRHTRVTPSPSGMTRTSADSSCVRSACFAASCAGVYEQSLPVRLVAHRQTAVHDASSSAHVGTERLHVPNVEHGTSDVAFDTGSVTAVRPGHRFRRAGHALVLQASAAHESLQCTVKTVLQRRKRTPLGEPHTSLLCFQQLQPIPPPPSSGIAATATVLTCVNEGAGALSTIATGNWVVALTTTDLHAGHEATRGRVGRTRRVARAPLRPLGKPAVHRHDTRLRVAHLRVRQHGAGRAAELGRHAGPGPSLAAAAAREGAVRERGPLRHVGVDRLRRYLTAAARVTAGGVAHANAREAAAVGATRHGRTWVSGVG